MWAHLLCWCTIIKGVFANRSHRNLTKGVKFFKTDMSSCIDTSDVISPPPKKTVATVQE